MYFTDTSELRMFEREMKQKPNFDRRNDDFSENGKGQYSDKEILKLNSKETKLYFLLH